MPKSFLEEFLRKKLGEEFGEDEGFKVSLRDSISIQVYDENGNLKQTVLYESNELKVEGTDSRG
jgi:predicted secreted protein